VSRGSAFFCALARAASPSAPTSSFAPKARKVQMAKNQNTFEKRRREVEKKQRADEKRKRRVERKTAGPETQRRDANPPPNESD
jgi:hypothetical protein